MTDGISFAELLVYTRDETARWRQWFEDNPAALEVPIGPAGSDTATLRGMLAHIFFCDLFYSELLAGKPRPRDEYLKIPRNTLDDLFTVATQADQQLRELLGRAMDEVISLGWPPEKPITGTRRKLLAHTIVHGLRHWAQVATALRQNGFNTGMQHDLIFSAALA